ncbi:MAG: PAS domain S-box protein [Candidatus Eisenbacteria bacterium]|uniref:histidine kinase n=1 Tax=Eiseniibacteriota bacterium TaxID=2212470 RepID=A0A933SB28_UNCEI|nr:PAS domain S-box protein [Candidatus Eisenbacteria bacterium]
MAWLHARTPATPDPFADYGSAGVRRPRPRTPASAVVVACAAAVLLLATFAQGWGGAAPRGLTLFTEFLLAGVAFAVWRIAVMARRLRRAEQRAERLALVAEHAVSAVLVADHDGRLLWANAALTQMTGWTAAQIVGRPVSEWLFGPGATELAERIREALRLGSVFRAEVPLRASDGRPFWGALEIVSVERMGAREGRCILTFHDVSAARASREALAASEARFRSALDAMAEGLLIQGSDGAIQMCNAAAERILGLPESQMAGRTSADPRWRATREDGTDFPGGEHPAMIALVTGRPVSGVIMGVHRPDGSHVWISIEANAIFKPGDERPVGVVTTFLDVTARRRSESEIRKLTQAIEQSPAACMILNASREIEYVNRCFEQITGWRSDEVLGRNLRLLASGHAPDAVHHDLWQAVSRGERWTGEVLQHRRDGEVFRARITAFPLEDSVQRTMHFVALFEDVTEEHRRSRELARAREEALAAARAKNEFLQHMSHELRTPMNGILGMTELLQQSELTPAQRADLDTLRTSADQLLTVISQLFDFTRLGDPAAHEARISFHLRQALAPVRDKLAGGAEARSLAWRFEVTPQAPDVFLGDPGGLRQVLLHLVDNALKFTNAGEVRVQVAAECTGGRRWRLRFEVHDTGIGIPRERQGSIFEAFEQADGSSTRKYGGLGLGLTLARLIVARMDGQLVVTSEPGKGSTFSFTVPLEQGEEDPQASRPCVPTVAPAADAAAPARSRLQGARIVLVDGGGVTRDQVVPALEHAGVRVDAVPGAEAAVALVRESGGGVSALVLDERGGGFDAFAVAKRLHEALDGMQPPTVLIAITGQRGDADRCRELGVTAYLTHPLGSADLGEALDRVLAAPAGPGGAHTLVTRHLLRESRRGVRVLLVEDNAVNRKVATRLLERTGFEVQVAEDGRAGLERFREGGWDVVLMDMQMPVMDGVTSARGIRAFEVEHGLARTPIVAVTAHTLDEDRDAARASGMDAFVTKPIQADDLLRAIRDCVGDAPADAAADASPPELREVIDWDEALERMDGDEAILGELLRLFLQDSGHMMERLEEARVSGDVKRIERAAHGLKGASATISARAVAPLAREVESLARDGKLVPALDRMQDLRLEMQRLRRALEALPEQGRKAA